MIPAITDARWKGVLQNIGKVQLNNLSTRMLMTRLKVMSAEKTEASQQRAIAAAFDFFVKNESMVQDDLKALFG